MYSRNLSRYACACDTALAMRLPLPFAQLVSVRFTRAITVVLTVSLAIVPALARKAQTPQLTCAPAPLHFGNVSSGGNETLYITLNNNQTSSLTISSAASSNPSFSLANVTFPLVIAGGQSVTIGVNFAPTAGGYTAGQISFKSNATDPTMAVEVGGTGVAQQALVATPASASFGTVAVGKSSTLPVVLTNKRSFSAVISSLKTSGGEFSVSGPGLPLTLKAGQSATLQVTFTPSAAGFAGGDVFVMGSSFNVTVPFTGTGGSVAATGSLTIAPAPLNFGSVNVGSSATNPITVTASGASVTISSASSTSSLFSLSGVSFPVTIAAGQSASFNVVFAPKSSGSASGTLSLASNASNSTATESMSGSGTATTTTGTLTIAPAPLSFGNVSVGNSETQAITVAASGASVTISSASSTSSLFSLSGATFPMTIAAGQSASFGVVFSPKASGAVSGTLAIASNASNSSATESLSGTGTPNAVTLSWTPSTSSVVGYNIYRGTASSGPFSKINSSMDTATNYTDGSVMGGNTYFYVATSVNSAGQESSFSSPALQAVVP
jgi:hypothetical protein